MRVPSPPGRKQGGSGNWQNHQNSPLCCGAQCHGGLWACPCAVLTMLVRISGSQGLRLSPIPQGTDRMWLPGGLPADSAPPRCPRPRLWHLGVSLPPLPGDTEPASVREQDSGHRFSKVLPRDSSVTSSGPQNFVPDQVALNKI